MLILTGVPRGYAVYQISRWSARIRQLGAAEEIDGAHLRFPAKRPHVVEVSGVLSRGSWTCCTHMVHHILKILEFSARLLLHGHPLYR